MTDTVELEIVEAEPAGTVLLIASTDGIRQMSPEESEETIKLNEQFAAEFALIEYQFQRASEYPPMTDYLDGIVKGDAVQVQKYIDDCLAVKLKYPKPEAS